ncbi:MAG TPA: histidinol-phosphate transaminase [Bacteroidetes bacterium]|nr:histidinol-phosphate transaminase [Bacteroidota bacterium]
MKTKRHIQDLVRPNIRRLEPYSSARDEYSGEAAVWLDANENPYPGQVQLVMRDPYTGRELAKLDEAGLNRYPDPCQRSLKEQISRYKGVLPEQVFLGNGSDEILDLLFRTFCDPGNDEIILAPPTYGMYAVLADIHGTPVKEVPMDESLQPSPPAILSQVTENTKMIFLCSPNNPTGNAVNKNNVIALLEQFKGLVVVDEAYIDFAPKKSILPLLEKYDKLVVLQTFSKALGLAGIRLGMAFASPEVFQWLNRVKLPYNVNRLTLALASLRFEEKKAQEEIVQKILEERKKLEKFLAVLPVVKKVYPSDANFLLVCFDNPERIYRYLMEKGIVVRLRKGIPGCGKAIRITVGTKKENKLLLQALDEYNALKK